MIENLISRYRFLLSLNNTPPQKYYFSIGEYRKEIRLKIEELNKLLKNNI